MIKPKITCSKCNQPKLPKHFGKRFGSGGHRRVRWCKSCCAEAVRKTYANSIKYRQSCKDRHQRLALENHTRIYEYLKMHPCVDCSEADPLVLQFDHVQGKHMCVTGMSLYSWKRILSEIAKCDVRCANCHAKKTAREQNTIRYQLSEQDKAAIV